MAKSTRHIRRERGGTAANTDTPIAPRHGVVIEYGTEGSAHIRPASAKPAKPMSATFRRIGNTIR